MKKLIVLPLLLILIAGCAEIKPLQLPEYNPPDLSSLTRPTIPPLIEGQDYTISPDKKTFIYTIPGQDKLVGKIIAEENAYKIIGMLRDIINVQSELIKQKDQLIIMIDLQRQYAERGRSYNEVKAILADIIAVIAMGLFIAK
jgi:hypothetical protein